MLMILMVLGHEPNIPLLPEGFRHYRSELYGERGYGIDLSDEVGELCILVLV